MNSDLDFQVAIFLTELEVEFSELNFQVAVFHFFNPFNSRQINYLLWGAIDFAWKSSLAKSTSKKESN